MRINQTVANLRGFDSQTSSLCQHLLKCMENSMENMQIYQYWGVMGEYSHIHLERGYGKSLHVFVSY